MLLLCVLLKCPLKVTYPINKTRVVLLDSMIRTPHILSFAARACLALSFLLTPPAGNALHAQGAKKATSAPDKGSALNKYIQGITASGPMRSALLGVMAKTESGKTLVNYNGERKLTPASNTKLLSTGLALNELGADYTFKTRLGYSGAVEDGTLFGDLYIIGGADPTLFSDDSIAIPQNVVLSRWLQDIRKAGINQIYGRIIGDGRFFEGAEDNPEWTYEDLGTYYGTGGNGLSFYRNVLDIQVAPGEHVGDSVKCEVTHPIVPWMRYDFNCKTGKEGTGDELYLYNTPLAPVAQMRGTFAIDRRPKKEECANEFGALTCAHYLREYLEENGITVSGIADTDLDGRIRLDPATWESAGMAEDINDLKIISTISSPSLFRICRITNYRSDNFYAEYLLRILSKEMTGSALYDSCTVARNKALRNIGIDPDYYRVRIHDGSGLARSNAISPEFFCDYLRAMKKTKVFPSFIGTMGQPGRQKYTSRLSKEPQELKDRIHMKSGSMGGVLCFSGYVDPSTPDGEMTMFSVMTNAYVGPGTLQSTVVEEIIALIAEMN